jgi:hypothetical protein
MDQSGTQPAAIGDQLWQRSEAPRTDASLREVLWLP